MNFLYWNLKSNRNLESIITDCILENDVDIALFSEYENVNFSVLTTNLHNGYRVLDSIAGCEKVVVFYKITIQLSIIQEQHRYLIAKLFHNHHNFLIIGVHLPSNPYSNSSDRKHWIQKIINDIAEIETESIQGSIVIGDMNASPFDNEMIEKDAFNSVLFKKIIENQEEITYQEDRYKRFYNPIIEYIDETNTNYGSFYYGSGNNCLYWYCYDQVLVRKKLIDKIKDFQYLKKIKNQDLLDNIKPNAKISDHLPLLVKISI